MLKCLQQWLFNLVLFVVISSSLILPMDTYAAEDPLIMGVFPRRNATTTLKFFLPIAKQLSSELNREVKLEISQDFPTFWNRVMQKKFDIVHYNQFHYISSHKKYGYRVIAHNQEFGKGTLAGIIMVRKDSGINSIEELRGKKIIFGGGKMAMMSNVVPKYLLSNSGLKEGDYIEEYAKNPPNSVMAVYYGQADAAGIGDIITKVPSVNQDMDMSQMKIVAQSEELAHIAWAVNSGLDNVLQDKIQHSLLSLNDSSSGRMLLEAANITALIKTNDAIYDPHRKIINEVFGEEY